MRSSNGKIVGLIPARGGSKGIPRKNVIDVAGKPLIAYVIEAAMEISELDVLYLSTDDLEIAETARRWGVEVIDRPSELARDETPAVSVMQHALNVLESNDQEQVDWLVLLQPTYPFIQPCRIREVIMECKSTQADSVTTIVEADFRYHPHNARVVNPKGSLSFLFPEMKAIMPNRQSAPTAYYFGNIVATKRQTIVEGSVYGNTSGYVVVEQWEAVDIDSPYDLQLCRVLIEHCGGSDCYGKFGI